MAGRPRQFDEQQALDAAMHVFWKRGFEAASIDELLDAMRLNAGSLYSTFGDKRKLFEKAFQNYVSQLFAASSETLNGPGTPLENLRTFVAGWGDISARTDSRGCLLSHTIIEFARTDDPILSEAVKLMTKIQRAFEKSLRAAKRTGELPAETNTKDLAAFLMSTAHGLSVLARSGADEEVIRGVVRTALTLLK